MGIMDLTGDYHRKALSYLISKYQITAPDHMDWVSLSRRDSEEPEDDSPQKIHAHVHDNNDLAILKIEDCAFLSNNSGDRGGALALFRTEAQVLDCVFMDKSMVFTD